MQTEMSALPEPSIMPSIHRLELEHSLYERRLDTLREKPYLTESEKMEEVRLKKLKLHTKDLMAAIQMRVTTQGPVRHLGVEQAQALSV